MGFFSRMFGKIKDAYARFMYGRYGADRLHMLLTVIALVLLVAEMLIPWFIPKLVVSALCWAVLIYSAFRVFSKNIYKRRAENEKFMRIVNRIKSRSALSKAKRRDRKTHVFKKCPECKNTLRLPRKKGKHSVKCPCCHKGFEVKI